MKIQRCCLTLLIFCLAIFGRTPPAKAQVDCAQLLTQADALLTQAATALTNGDLATAQALVTAARAVIAPCVGAGGACATIGQADTVLGQIETATDATTASALLSGAQALLDPCLTTASGATPTISNLPPAPTPTAPATTPTGNLIAYISGPLTEQGFPSKTDIFVMSADGTGVVQLTTNGIPTGPAWSPDGSQIAYQDYGSSGFDIFVMNADGSSKRNLTNYQAGGSASTPSWSPDGRQIAFDAEQGDASDLFVISVDGTGLRNLTNSPTVSETDPAWSPDGTQFAYTSNQSGTADIWLMNADGSNARNFSAQTEVQMREDEGNAAWSPNGVMIAFQLTFEGAIQIMLQTTNLTGAANLIRDFGNSVEPAWSPDGSSLLFRSDVDGDNEIYKVSVDSNVLPNNPVPLDQIQQLTNNADFDGQPAWQPGGSSALPPAPTPTATFSMAVTPLGTPASTTSSTASNGLIIFGSGPINEQGFPTAVDLFVMNPDGGGRNHLTTDGKSYNPAWSPDGTQIAFDGQPGESIDIFAMNADRSNVRNLTPDNTSWDYDPAWSPDGTQIAFTSDQPGNNDVFVMNADGSSLRNLTNHPSSDRQAAWSPDGTQIAFVTDRDGTADVWIMNADGSNPYNLTAQTDAYRQGVETSPDWSPNGQFIVFQAILGESNIIMVATPDITGAATLVQDFGTVRLPAWSPDGTQLVFASNVDGDYEIFVVNADSTQFPDRPVSNSDIRQLTFNDYWDSSPDWQAVGGTIPPPVPTSAATPTFEPVATEEFSDLPTLTPLSEPAATMEATEEASEGGGIGSLGTGRRIIQTLPGGFPSGSIRIPGEYDNGAIAFEFDADWYLIEETNSPFPIVRLSTLSEPSASPEEGRQNLENGAIAVDILFLDPLAVGFNTPVETPGDVMALAGESLGVQAVEYTLPNGLPVARALRSVPEDGYDSTILTAIVNDRFIILISVHRMGDSAAVLPAIETILNTLAYDPNAMVGVPPGDIEAVNILSDLAAGMPFRFVHSEIHPVNENAGFYCVLVDPPINGQNAFVLTNTNGAWEARNPVREQWNSLGCRFAEAIVAP